MASYVTQRIEAEEAVVVVLEDLASLEWNRQQD